MKPAGDSLPTAHVLFQVTLSMYVAAFISLLEASFHQTQSVTQKTTEEIPLQVREEKTGVVEDLLSQLQRLLVIRSVQLRPDSPTIKTHSESLLSGR